MKPVFYILLFAMAGCATPQYQKYMADNTYKVGYFDQKLSQTKYRVRYVDTTEEKALVGFMRRASQITLENGYRFFIEKDNGASRDSSTKWIISGVAHDASLPQYSGTIILTRNESENTVDAKEFLKTNPIPAKK